MSCCKIMVPASSANLGSGFDTFGIALSLYCYAELRKGKLSNGILIYEGPDKKEEIGVENIVYKSFIRILEELKVPQPKDFHIWIKNHIPIGKGLGSSASAITCGLMLGYIYTKENNLLPKEYENLYIAKEKLILPLAEEIEGHPDNVTPCIMGGFTISGIDSKKRYIKIDFPEDIKLIFVIPNIEVSTKYARSSLPKCYKIKEVVANIRSSPLLILGIVRNDSELISLGLRDEIHQKYRKHLYGHFAKLLDYKDEELIGTFVSGSGPTMALLTKTQNIPSFLNRVRKYLSNVPVNSYDIQILRVDNQGARII